MNTRLVITSALLPPRMLRFVVLAGPMLLGSLPAIARAQSTDPGPSFAVRAKRIYPVTADQPGAIERGMLIVRDGRIVAVGANLTLPTDVKLIDLPDHVICPGFVAAASDITIQHRGRESVGAGYDALDSFDRYADYRTHLSWGTTTAHVSPGGHRLVTGAGGVVKLGGRVGGRILMRDADLSINLGQFDPPKLVDVPFYASSDEAIRPSRRQRPDSRLGQFLELEQRIAGAAELLANIKARSTEKTDYHAWAFARRWSAGAPLRIQARRAADIEGALAFVRRHKRSAYLVGMAQGDLLTEALLASRLPVVLRLEETYDRSTFLVGDNPNALETVFATAGRLAAAKIALAGREGEPADLRMVAMMAMRGGMSRAQALAAITRVPAEILGVAARVGSLSPGRDADFLVMTDEPLAVSSHVVRTYVNGHEVFRAPQPEALVVRAGTVWTGEGAILSDASILIEDGKIQAVGQRVPHPPYARVIDAGAAGFVTPGFIDAHGHLGLERDSTTISSDVKIQDAIGVVGREFLRVARAGVTTVMLAAYRSGANGSRVAAIKTFGPGRDECVARGTSGLKFSLTRKDPLLETKKLRDLLEKAKKYDEKWKKYFEELEKWKKDQAEGKQPTKKVDVVEEVVEGVADPITGTWEYTISGGPIPEPVSGQMLLKLTGTDIEGRLQDPTGGGEEAVLTGTLEGDVVRLIVDQETPVGNPEIEATLEHEDYMKGVLSLGGMFSLDFEATRTDKSAVEFKVQRRKRKRKDGKPVPPKVDESLEPYRLLLAGTIPAVVETATAAEVLAALKVFVDDYKISVVLLGADNAADVVDELKSREDKVGVVVPPQVIRRRNRVDYNQAADLSRKGIRVGFQSNSEDAARNLPLMGLFAVQQGLGGDAALRALTIDAARMYGLDDRIGAIAPGKDADLLIHTGHPFDAGSRLERVIVGGHEVPIDDK